jgi:adenosylmethionine-8-amino-7-oxononanoate aminotransferase
MTGFCRTGKYFAHHQLEIIPDFLCISKGITGGFLPLALTITNNKIYDAFLGDNFKTAFAHGHSYTANPLACRAAVTSLSLLKSAQCQNAIKNINYMHQNGIKALKLDCPRVEKIRNIGTIAAFDIKNLDHLIPSLKQNFLKEGILLRPLGNTVYLLPLYSITNDEIELVYRKITKLINAL